MKALLILQDSQHREFWSPKMSAKKGVFKKSRGESLDHWTRDRFCPNLLTIVTTQQMYSVHHGSSLLWYVDKLAT